MSWRFLAFLGALLVSSGLQAESVPAFQEENGTGAGQQSSGGSELFFMLQQLQREVQELRGMVERQQRQLDQLSRQSKDRYIDLDQRILDLSRRLSEQQSGGSASAGTGSALAGTEAGASTPKADQAEATASQDNGFRPPTPEEQAAYDAIKKKIDEKQFQAAINGLYGFISKYEQGDLTINAYYWLGEVYLAENQLEQAKQAFTIVTARYPGHRKAPDALYKMGVALQRQGKTAEAKKKFQQVLETYPQSNAASLARESLNKL